MAREVKAYLCDYKCGRKITRDIEDIKNHEKICWKNPKVKSCMTCKHEKTKGTYTTYLEDDFRSCAISEISGATFSQEEVDKERKAINHMAKRTIYMPKTNCQHWENK